MNIHNLYSKDVIVSLYKGTVAPTSKRLISLTLIDDLGGSLYVGVARAFVMPDSFPVFLTVSEDPNAISPVFMTDHDVATSSGTAKGYYWMCIPSKEDLRFTTISLAHRDNNEPGIAFVKDDGSIHLHWLQPKAWMLQGGLVSGAQ